MLCAARALVNTLDGSRHAAARSSAVVHRDTLLAAQERILALERELESARAREGESIPATVARLEKEKRALEAESSRLRVERQQLLDDLTKAKAALARAEEEATRAKSEVKDALAIRDQLRKQAITEAARAGAVRRAEAPPPPRKRRSSRGRVDQRAEGAAITEERVTRRPPDAEPRVRELVALDAHNLALPPLPSSPEHAGAGVLCPSCLARGDRVEMIASRSALGLGDVDAISTACLRCGATGVKRAR